MIAVIGGGAVLFSVNKSNEQPKGQKSTTFTFSNPKKSAHYESNTPEHGTILPAPPVNVVIDVNFDLSQKSSISITSGGKEYGTGDTIIDQSKLAMRRKVDGGALDGLYTVSYTACWPDKTCHDGQFQFAIDRTRSSEYEDMRGKKEITISISDIAFAPKMVRISKGTKVIWRNDEAVGHYVNTDPHAGHTYYPKQNSQLLNKGDTYSVMFDEIGFYPYHCSAHAANMTASLLVE